MGRPCLSVITFDAKGGGVAAVSRLLRGVMEERWMDTIVRELASGTRSSGNVDSSTLDRVRFGAGLLWRQALGVADWVLYSHVAVAQVQSRVPRAARRPYAVFIHGFEIWGVPNASHHRVIAGAALRLSNSHFTARRVAPLLPGSGPIVPCPLALPDPVVPRRSHGQLELGPRTVISVGRMVEGERYKGHDEILDAWPDVKRRVPDARLIFIGEGSDVVRLRQKAHDLGIGHDVLFTGFVTDEELRRFYEAAALFVMPSRGEGFGLVYLEAMSHRLPCIGSIHDAATEVIEDGVTGFLVDQADVPALAGRMVQLLTDDSKRQDMGARGYERLQAHFTREQFASRLMPHLDAAFGKD